MRFPACAGGTPPIRAQVDRRLAEWSPRSWLYNQPDLRAEIERLRARRDPAPGGQRLPSRQRASDTSLLRRLEVMAERNRQLEAENRQLREALAVALGEQRAATIVGPLSAY